MTRSESARLTLALSSHLGQREVAPLSAGHFWKTIEAVGDPASLAGRSEDSIVEETGMPPELARQIVSLIDGAFSVALAAEQFEQQGIFPLTPFDEDYPQRLRERLGTAAPPVLYVAGDAAQLSRPGIGIVGSRDIDERVLEVARAAAALAVKNDMPVVSGGARGVDQVAMQAAFDHGGVVLGVLADSRLRRVRDADTRRAILDGRAVLLTPHNPSLGFTVANAMARNKLIYALSEVTLVVACTPEKGGTWAGATEALRRGYGRVAVWTGKGSPFGNSQLEQGGPAAAVKDLSELLTLLQNDDDSSGEMSAPHTTGAQQLGLDLT